MGLSPHLLAIPALCLAWKHLDGAFFSVLGKITASLAAVAVLGLGALSNNFYLPVGDCRRALIGAPFRKVKLGFRALIMSTITKKVLEENHWQVMLPALERAKVRAAADFARARPIDISAEAMNQWQIMPTSPEMLARVETCMHDSLSGDESRQAQTDKEAMLNALVAEALPRVHIPGRKAPLTLEDCYIFSCTQERGAYFPHIHWDTEYLAFPEVEAFQLWFLVSNDRPTGNMFMVSTPDLQPCDAPCRYLLQPEGGVLKVHHDLNDEECPIKRFPRAEDARLGFEYLGMSPGDCLIFSKRTLHCSDPRPHLKGETVERLAMNVRVLVRPEHRPTFNIWPGHKYFGLMSKMKALAKTIEKDPESGQPLKRDGYKQLIIPSRMHLVAMQ